MRPADVEPPAATRAPAERQRPGTAPSDADAPTLDRVARYYDYMTPYYRVFWHGSTGGVHYGLRDHTTRGSRDELLNTNRVLADAAGITSADRVLDAGCGVGGSALWLARHRGAEVVGVTLSHAQLAIARERARAARQGGVRYEVANYCDTGFASESFDVVWALESSCYAGDRGDFLREARRLLKPGGRLVIGDGFRKRDVRSAHERAEYAHFLEGLLLPDLQSIDALLEILSEAGFDRPQYRDVTDAARPSSRRMHRACIPAYQIARALERIGLFDPMMSANARAGVAQYRIVRSGLAGYFVVTARKPGRSTTPSHRATDRRS